MREYSERGPDVDFAWSDKCMEMGSVECQWYAVASSFRITDVIASASHICKGLIK